MNFSRNKRGALVASLAVAAFALSACSSDDPTTTSAAPGVTEAPALSGDVAIDGSSTVAPLSEAAAVDFADVQGGVNVTVATSGTGGGFKVFCADETDISDASRPIKDEEAQLCADAGVEFTEIVIANDGLSVVVNPENDWAQCLTVEQLNKIWAPEAEGTVMNWNQVDPSFPDQPLALFGPGTDSGTFDYFTDEINGEEGASRADYSPSEDDNVLVQGVAGDVGGLGYFGLSYAVENADILKLVDVDGGNGCVTPTIESVQDGSYTPLGRPLFIYVNNASYTDKAQVKAFVDYYVSSYEAVATAAGMVPLTTEQVTTAQDELATLG
jgi:phosphate transport system substrate-binding protein